MAATVRNKTKIAISIDTGLLDRVNAVCEARNEKRSALIERVLLNEIKSEERFVKEMENPVMRLVARAMVENPLFVNTLAKFVSDEMTPDLADKFREHMPKQIELGKERAVTKKRTKKTKGRLATS